MSKKPTFLLEVAEPRLQFGGVVALDGPRFFVEQGEICGLIGPNGAGKSSLLNCISRLYQPQSGEIVLNGRNINEYAPHQMAAMGVGRTFQTPTLVSDLSVRENVLIGNHPRMHSSPLAVSLRLPAAMREERLSRRAVDALLLQLELDSHAEQPVKSLPFDVIRRTEIARALIAAPSLLLLDEPTGGLSEIEIASLGDLLRHLCEERRLGIVLIEHHMKMLMDVSDKVVVMYLGASIAQGSPTEVQSNPLVIDAYLGKAS